MNPLFVILGIAAVLVALFFYKLTGGAVDPLTGIPRSAPSGYTAQNPAPAAQTVEGTSALPSIPLPTVASNG